MYFTLRQVSPEDLDHLSDTATATPADHNSEDQTVMVTSAIVISVIVLILVVVATLLVRRKRKQRQLRETRAREASDLCVDGVKYGV